MEIKDISKEVEGYYPKISRVFDELGKVIIGQKDMLKRMIVGLLTNGHVLIEGVPGLAKTLSVFSLSRLISADFKRIQFTPDLLPADLIGTLVYNQKDGSFRVRKGPIFTNILLADEINRSPAKVQSALLEAMQERQVTIGDTTYRLDFPFFVLATQNPIEQEGTYPLPEAQLDRFILKIKVGFPTREEEIMIMKEKSVDKEVELNPVLNSDDIRKLQSIVAAIYVDERIYNYVMDVVEASRKPSKYGIDENLVDWGASVRASIYLIRAARAWAFLHGRSHVMPDDIRVIGYDVLRHRIIPSYEAEAEGLDSDDIIKKIFDNVEVP